jgi:hypothetical protein
VLERSAAQKQTSADLIARSAALAASIPASRRCPDCGSMLEWIERGLLRGVEYDFYRWCE